MKKRRKGESGDFSDDSLADLWPSDSVGEKSADFHTGKLATVCLQGDQRETFLKDFSQVELNSHRQPIGMQALQQIAPFVQIRKKVSFLWPGSLSVLFWDLRPRTMRLRLKFSHTHHLCEFIGRALSTQISLCLRLSVGMHNPAFYTWKHFQLQTASALKGRRKRHGEASLPFPFFVICGHRICANVNACIHTCMPMHTCKHTQSQRPVG